MKKILKQDWVWYGNAGHFICSARCRFHLTTKIGKYLISSVGEFVADYLKNPKCETIGYNRLYETMVFEAGKPCECGCGLPEISGSELDMNGYNTAKDATEGHNKLCKKWSKQ